MASPKGILYHRDLHDAMGTSPSRTIVGGKEFLTIGKSKKATLLLQPASPGSPAGVERREVEERQGELGADFPWVISAKTAPLVPL